MLEHAAEDELTQELAELTEHQHVVQVSSQLMLISHTHC